ncbi:hypothetical protein H0H93_002589, partial [Arthromyces matolae]
MATPKGEPLSQEFKNWIDKEIKPFYWPKTSHGKAAAGIPNATDDHDLNNWVLARCAQFEQYFGSQIHEQFGQDPQSIGRIRTRR